MKFRQLLATISLLASFAPVARAEILPLHLSARGEFPEVSFSCPLGGEQFSQATSYPHFPFQIYPDGSHPGDLWIEMQIPECPSNGLLLIPDHSKGDSENGQLIYHRFSADDLAKLPELLASEDYTALRGTTRQARAFWLAMKLGKPSSDQLELLMQAGWGASERAARNIALGLMVDHAPVLIESSRKKREEREYLQTLVANAYRELGRFDEALAVLAKIEGRTKNFATPALVGEVFADVAPFGDKLRAIIAERNTDAVPIALLDNRTAISICANAFFESGTLSPRLEMDCEPLRENRVVNILEFPGPIDLEIDVETINHEICANGVADGTIANFAFCDTDGTLKNQDEANIEPTAAEIIGKCRDYSGELDADGDYDGELYFLCKRYQEARDDALAEYLVIDDDAFALYCTQPYSFGPCSKANEIRADLAASKLVSDIAPLSASCAATPKYERPMALFRACYALETGGGNAYWEGYLPFSNQDAELRSLLASEAERIIAEAQPKSSQ